MRESNHELVGMLCTCYTSAELAERKMRHDGGSGADEEDFLGTVPEEALDAAIAAYGTDEYERIRREAFRRHASLPEAFRFSERAEEDRRRKVERLCIGFSSEYLELWLDELSKDPGLDAGHLPEETCGAWPVARHPSAGELRTAIALHGDPFYARIRKENHEYEVELLCVTRSPEELAHMLELAGHGDPGSLRRAGFDGWTEEVLRDAAGRYFDERFARIREELARESNSLDVSCPKMVRLCTEYSLLNLERTAEELREKGCRCWMDAHGNDFPPGVDAGEIGRASLEELEFAAAHYQDGCFEKPRKELAERQVEMLATYYSRDCLAEQYEELADDPQDPRRLHIAAAMTDYGNPRYVRIREERMSWLGR